MSDVTRRGFLHGSAAVLGCGPALGIRPGLIERAMAIPANRATGSLMDVQHIVVFMQENRSFDHYFGLLNGVRGFGDPRPLRLSGGRSVWLQPSDEHAHGYVMPYHGDSRTTRSFTVDGADQGHQTNLTIFNRGRYDRWGVSRELHNRMLYYGPGDLPFYYALANAFTVCDAYHCSTLTQTYPNRLHLFTGCNGGGSVGGDPEMHNYGEDETPSADMATDKPLRPDAYRWTTYAERLQAAGIDWKVYQEYDNFGDNLLSVFPPFRPCDKNSALYTRGRSWVSEQATGPDRTRSDGEQLVAAFRADVAAGRLPQISWIVTAADLSEHPQAEPSKGEHVCAKLVEALVDHPEVFAKTVFIVNYDEAGGFYDHMPPPVPPVGQCRGHSTVSVAGEAKDYADAAVANPGQQPLGLGVRVPAIIVSPWSRGGYVCSQLFDHTSVLQFMERRFGVAEPNISPWRRAVCGDLTSAFDFTRADGDTARLAFPDTADFMARVAQSKAGTANAIPARQQPVTQLPGRRPSRPLPYDVAVDGELTPDGRLRLMLRNDGAAGAVLTVHDNLDAQAPLHFTMGAGDTHTSGLWQAEGQAAGQRYDFTVRGPDGLHQRYAGPLGEDRPRLAVKLTRQPALQAVGLTLVNSDDRAWRVRIGLDPACQVVGLRLREHVVPPCRSVADVWQLVAGDGWYDLAVALPEAPAFVRRFAGKLETGKPGLTDPAIGVMRTLM